MMRDFFEIIDKLTHLSLLRLFVGSSQDRRWMNRGAD